MTTIDLARKYRARSHEAYRARTTRIAQLNQARAVRGLPRIAAGPYMLHVGLDLEPGPGFAAGWADC